MNIEKHMRVKSVSSISPVGGTHMLVRHRSHNIAYKIFPSRRCLKNKSMSRVYGSCWEIASNFKCDLESQLGFLVEEGKIDLGFLVIEGKTIPWCGLKSIPC